jgi:hypothetical protein
MTDAPNPAMLARRALLAAGGAVLATSAAAQGVVLGGSGEGVVPRPAPEEPSTIPFVYEGGRILINLGFASGEAAPVMIDTGYADKIHLASSGNLPALGAGERSVQAGLAHGAPNRSGLFTVTGSRPKSSICPTSSWTVAPSRALPACSARRPSPAGSSASMSPGVN